MKNIFKYLLLTTLVMLFVQCATDDGNTQYVAPTNPVISHPNDQFLYNNNGNSLFERYNTATRWRWNDNFIAPTQRATPIRAEFVIPTTKLVDYLWIGPYIASGTGGAKLINDIFPAELIYIGSNIFEDDGSEIAGFAEGGARIAILNLNGLDFQDRDWLAGRLGFIRIVHHEFPHLVEQLYGRPSGFNVISEKYIGQNWNNPPVLLDNAIKLGMVSNYATSAPYDDFAETVAVFLQFNKVTFDQLYFTQEDCSQYSNPDAIVNCRELNEGRLLIKKKVDLVTSFYKNTVNVDLSKVRDTLQVRLEKLIATGVIPD